MVAACRAGLSLREVAEKFGESKSTVQRWVETAKGKRLDRVDFGDKKSGPKKPKNKSGDAFEKRVLRIRKFLKEKSVLGLYGAEAVHNELKRKGEKNLPTVRTIANILKRNGMVDRRTRIRRPPPPPGWYLDDLQRKKVELDTFDIIEGLYLEGGMEIQFFNGISVHGNLIHSKAMETVTTENAILALTEHWKTFGLPKYAQFDNDMVFQGSRRKNVIGKVIRFCLSLGVTPVFSTPYEQGFQGKIERFNKELQDKLWRRYRFKNLNEISRRLNTYVKAHRFEHQGKILSCPARKPFPKHWKRDDAKPLKGRIVYLRRTDGEGKVRILENEFHVDEHWINRLIRAEVDLNKNKIRFYALRRAEWKKHRLIKTVVFKLKLTTRIE